MKVQVERLEATIPRVHVLHKILYMACAFQLNTRRKVAHIATSDAGSSQARSLKLGTKPIERAESQVEEGSQALHDRSSYGYFRVAVLASWDNAKCELGHLRTVIQTSLGHSAEPGDAVERGIAGRAITDADSNRVSKYERLHVQSAERVSIRAPHLKLQWLSSKRCKSGQMRDTKWRRALKQNVQSTKLEGNREHCSITQNFLFLFLFPSLEYISISGFSGAAPIEVLEVRSPSQRTQTDDTVQESEILNGMKGSI